MAESCSKLLQTDPGPSFGGSGTESQSKRTKTSPTRANTQASCHQLEGCGAPLSACLTDNITRRGNQRLADPSIAACLVEPKLSRITSFAHRSAIKQAMTFISRWPSPMRLSRGVPSALSTKSGKKQRWSTFGYTLKLRDVGFFTFSPFSREQSFVVKAAKST